MSEIDSTGARGPASEQSIRERLEDAFWARHSNPWSGWSRVALSPVLVYSLYRRNFRLLAAALVFAVVNPVVFPRPERTDNWMSRSVLAEREWIEAGNGTMGLSYPNVLNLLSAPTWLLALYAAVRRRPVLTVLGTAAAMALKLSWIDEIVDLTGVTGEGPTE